MRQWIGKILIAMTVILTLALLWMLPKPARNAIGQQTMITRPDGAHIIYYTSGLGRRVLLLASLGRSVSDFNELVLALNEAGYRTIAVDMRGVGKSTFGAGNKTLTLFSLADDAAAALFQDGGTVEDVAFGIGHAFGNRVIRAMTSRYPEYVDGLVLVAAGGSQKLEPDQRITQALQNSFDWHLLPPKRKSEIRYAFFADGETMPGYWLNGWYAKAAAVQVRAVLATKVADWRAGGGSVPMLVLQGAEDRIAPAATTSSLLAQDFPARVKIITLDNAGHAILPEQPDQVAQEIVQFLDQLN